MNRDERRRRPNVARCSVVMWKLKRLASECRSEGSELHTATKVGGRLVGCEEDFVVRLIVRLVEIGGSSTKGSELLKVDRRADAAGLHRRQTFPSH
jgi:hypothetical protein